VRRQRACINYGARTLTAGGVTLKEGEYLSIDGTTGEIYAGMIETTDSEVQRVLSGAACPGEERYLRPYETVMGWADKTRRMKIRTNADTPAMAKAAIAFGAEGIGLCRTEHMFFEGNRIDYMRQMILAADVEQRRAALKKAPAFPA
jgi:pyruvate,orthophosphate dikinase